MSAIKEIEALIQEFESDIRSISTELFARRVPQPHRQAIMSQKETLITVVSKLKRALRDYRSHEPEREP